MRTEKIIALSVSETDEGSEYYRVGDNQVTEIKWSTVNGHMAPLDTVQVYRNGVLHSEHMFANCSGVYFASPEGIDQ